MEKKTKILIGISVLAAISVGAIFYFRLRKKDEALVDGIPAETGNTIDQKGTVKDQPIKEVIPKTLKSKGINYFVPQTVKDGKYVPSMGKVRFDAGQLIGKVLKETASGYYIMSPSNTIVWAEKNRTL